MKDESIKYCIKFAKSFFVADVNEADKELTAMQARIEKLEAENSVMYAAILEASELGNSAALRCKVELQRIARNDVK